MAKGSVKWFSNNKGYGFIESEEDGEVFVHFSEIRIDGYKSLKEGKSVEYELASNEKGQMAKNVRLHIK